MKPRTLKFLAPWSLLFLIAISITSCLEDECTRAQTFTRWVPVFVSTEEVRQNITTEAPRQLEDPGVIYYYKNFLLINERREGIHIYDNSDVRSPQPIGFLSIPGNLDMAIRDDVLYADMYTDLLSIDISDPLSATVMERVESVFDRTIPWVEGDGFLVEWRETRETVTIDCSDQNWGRGWFWGADGRGIFVSTLENSATDNAGGAPVGVGGSMARFTVVGDHLYALDQRELETFNIANQDPVFSSTAEVSWNIETIFPSQENLFIGAETGMFIYSLNDPGNPTYVSEFRHARACDPVYVKDDLAYVTLRDGQRCQTFTNQLDIIDISDIDNPGLLHSYQMQNPHGLSVTEDHLYLCEGDGGLKVFETDDLSKLDEHLISHFQDMNAFDIIVLNDVNVALLIGEDGLFQYDISNPESLELLSHIAVND